MTAVASYAAACVVILCSAITVSTLHMYNRSLGNKLVCVPEISKSSSIFLIHIQKTAVGTNECGHVVDLTCLVGKK